MYRLVEYKALSQTKSRTCGFGIDGNFWLLRGGILGYFLSPPYNLLPAFKWLDDIGFCSFGLQGSGMGDGRDPSGSDDFWLGY